MQMKKKMMNMGWLYPAIFFIIITCWGNIALPQQQIVQIHGVTYALKDGRWYTYINNQFGSERIPNRIVVRRTDRGSLTEKDLVALGVPDTRFASPRFLEGYYVISPIDSMKSFEVAQKLSLSGLFDYVVLDGYGKRGVSPNDQYFSQQWNLKGTKLRMENAWDITIGSSSIILGIVDSGCDYGHPDLSGNIWSNIGWDFVDYDNSPIDIFGHGTNVTGVPGARTNNSIGLAGIAGGWSNQVGVSLMILKDGNQDPITSLTAQALEWAADHGAKVLNISSQFETDDPLLDILEDAINYAVGSFDVVVVAISGNHKDSYKNDWSIRYPGRWSNVIASGATDQNDVRFSNSLYGPELDVVAPSMVYTTDIRGSGGMVSGDYYDSFAGTSAAAPHVAGLAALIRTIDPSLNWSQVREIICNTADKVPGMGGQPFTDYYGYGRINAHAAVLKALDGLPSRNSISSQATAYNGGRRMVKSGNNLYLVYESGNQVYFTKSTNDGSTWSNPPTRLSDGFGVNKSASTTERSGKLYVIWQRYDGSSHDIYFRKSSDGGTTWSSASEIASNVGASDPLPVIASPATNELMTVYRSGNNLSWKRSTNDGSSWPTSGSISAGTGEVLNSPSITATRLPWSSNVTGLAYATKEIPNASHIITRYFYNGAWSSANNISSSLPGNLSQHTHPSASHSGTSTADYQHVAWDAYSSYDQSRVIIHRKGTAWAFGSQYWELHYQEEDRPTISGLTGNTAHIAYQRGTAYHFTAHFDGTGWSVQFPAISGSYPSFSMGNTSAKYVWTSGSSSPYTINVSSTNFSKPVVNDSQQIVYQRSVAVVDTVTEGWFDVRVEQMAITPDLPTSEAIDFVAIPSSLKITPTDGFNALASQSTFVPTTAESLIVCYFIGGENLSAVKNPAKSVGVELQIVTTNGTTLSMPVYTTNSDMIGKQAIKVAVAAAAYVGKEITIKTQVSGIASKSVLVASLGHIYQMVDTKKDAPLVYSTVATPPADYELQAYPNPFNPNTEIRFALREAAVVTVRIYNIQGQLVTEVLNQYCPAGRQTVQWDGKNAQGNDLASGIYVCQIKAGSLVATQKLTLIR